MSMVGDPVTFFGGWGHDGLRDPWAGPAPCATVSKLHPVAPGGVCSVFFGFVFGLTALAMCTT